MYKAFVFAGGAFFFAVAVYHLMFWRILKWKTELATVSASNRNVMQILNICLVILFIIFGYLMIIHVDELLTTHLGGDFLIALALFWFARGLQEIYFFRLRTRRSKVNLMLCILAAGLFLTPGLGVLSA